MNLKIDLENTILIIPNNIKKKVIKYINNLPELTNTKVLTIEEFKTNLTFDYNEKTIYYLIKNHNLSYQTSIEYLKSMKYLLDDKYNENKLANLLKLKKELESKNLLIINKYFINYLKDKNIYFYGFNYIDKFTKELIKRNNLEVNYIEKNLNSFNHPIYLFESPNEEVEFIAEEISKNNLDLNKTYIYGINKDNKNIIKRIFKSYNIPINIKENNTLYDTYIGKELLNNLDNYENYIMNIKDENIKKSLINIINKYYFIENFNDIKDIIKEELKSAKLKQNNQTNAINETDIKNNIYDEDEYVYILSFNNEYIPEIQKDTNYISDNEKPKYIEKTIELNNINKEIINNSIKNIKNLTITSSKSNDTGKLNTSTIALDYNYEIIEKEITPSKYSNKINRYNLCKILDDYLKYDNKNKYQDILLNTYKNYEYKKYSNTYNKINFNETFTLSYSKMNNYYECPFKYYCENILKLSKYEDTFDTYIGSLCHHILSKIYDEDFDFEKVKNSFNENSKYILTKENEIFTTEILKELQYAINYILSNQRITNFKEIECEKRIETTIKDIKFIGIFDKIQKMNDYIIITDYKTGTPIIDLKLCNYGFNLQLPTYIFLIKKLYPSSKIVGVYLEHILKPKTNYDQNKTPLESYEESLKLQGYTISNEDIISNIDFTYENSKQIKSLKMGKDGFSRYAKLLSEEDFKNLEELVEKKISECIDGIKEANFDIKPVIIDGKNKSCEYCDYASVCHHTEKDFIYINTKEEGEENNEMD